MPPSRPHALLENIGGRVHDAGVDVPNCSKREQAAACADRRNITTWFWIDGHGAPWLACRSVPACKQRWKSHGAETEAVFSDIIHLSGLLPTDSQYVASDREVEAAAAGIESRAPNPAPGEANLPSMRQVSRRKTTTGGPNTQTPAPHRDVRPSFVVKPPSTAVRATVMAGGIVLDSIKGQPL